MIFEILKINNLQRFLFFGKAISSASPEYIPTNQINNQVETNIRLDFFAHQDHMDIIPGSFTV